MEGRAERRRRALWMGLRGCRRDGWRSRRRVRGVSGSRMGLGGGDGVEIGGREV